MSWVQLTILMALVWGMGTANQTGVEDNMEMLPAPEAMTFGAIATALGLDKIKAQALDRISDWKRSNSNINQDTDTLMKIVYFLAATVTGTFTAGVIVICCCIQKNKEKRNNQRGTMDEGVPLQEL